jgi:hypothetical protein
MWYLRDLFRVGDVSAAHMRDHRGNCVTNKKIREGLEMSDSLERHGKIQKKKKTKHKKEEMRLSTQSQTAAPEERMKVKTHGGKYNFTAI